MSVFCHIIPNTSKKSQCLVLQNISLHWPMTNIRTAWPIVCASFVRCSLLLHFYWVALFKYLINFVFEPNLITSLYLHFLGVINCASTGFGVIEYCGLWHSNVLFHAWFLWEILKHYLHSAYVFLRDLIQSLNCCSITFVLQKLNRVFTQTHIV